MSSTKATQPPAVCLDVEEIGEVFDEVFAYLIFQRKDLLDDYVIFNFKEIPRQNGDWN